MIININDDGYIELFHNHDVWEIPYERIELMDAIDAYHKNCGKGFPIWIKQENEDAYSTTYSQYDIPFCLNGCLQCWLCKNRVGSLTKGHTKYPECKVADRYMTEVYHTPCDKFQLIKEYDWVSSKNKVS